MIPTGIDRGSASDSSKGWTEALREKVEACPREAEHAYGPYGYIQWHSWAERMRKTHKQRQCECGLWLLIEPK